MSVEFAVQMMHPELKRALERTGIRKLTEFQERAFRKIAEGKDVLIVAPTGSGKTEAAMIPLFNRILELKERWAKKEDGKGKGIILLYITPLRALNRDMFRRLRRIAEMLGITIDLRHGDTPGSRRSRQSRSPPDVLITTPETLQILFLGKRLRSYLRTVKFVVIDEIHELVDSERGTQLSVGLERLREIASFQTIALSATVSKSTRIRFFVGRNADIVDESGEKKYSFTVMARFNAAGDVEPEVELIKDVASRHKSVLIFVNTRATAEALGLKLKKLMDVEVHHGSLSKEARVEAEEKFARGELKALICTSSMELGIDIGHVDAVIQFNSPRQVVRLIQRVGRSGHRLGEVSRGYIVANNFDDILESWAIVRRAERGLLEDEEIHFKSLDVLANQIAAMSLEYGKIDARRAFEIVRRSYFYRNLSFEEFDEVCRFLAEIGRIFYENGEIIARRRTRMYFYDNISMIPDERRYRVVDITTGKSIGTLDESFLSTFSGEVFTMKGELWRVVSVDDVVRVEPVTAEGEIPSWAGEEIPVPFEVAQDVGKIRMWVASLIRSYGRKEAVKMLVEEFETNEEAAEKVVDVISENVEKGFPVPTDNHITVEGRETCVVNACFGHKVNEALGRVLALLLSARKGRNVSVEIDPYRIKLHPANADEVLQTLLSIEPNSTEFLVERALWNTRLLEWKVVNVARKFGVLGKDEELSRINVRNLVSRLKDTPIYREALREIFLERMDVRRLEDVLDRIKSGEITCSSYGELSPISTASMDRSIDFVTAKPDALVLKEFRRRIEREMCRVYCLNCGASYVENVGNFNTFSCLRCKSRMIAVFSNRRKIEEFSKEELFRIANLVMSYGKRAVYAMNAYGVGAETAARILSRYYSSDDEFFKALLKAERNFVKTRRFWS